MALPTFEYDRRIDVIDALNELSVAADAAIEGGGGSSQYVLPVAADAVLGGVKGQRVEEKDGNGRIVQVTPDGTAFIDAADALNPGVVRSKEGNSFGGTGGGVARADVIDIVKQALQSAVLTDNGTLQFTLPD